MAENEQMEAFRKLGFTDEEIADMLKCDKAIDRGERMDFDLSPVEEKRAKKYANVDTKKKPKGIKLDATPRKRKENPTKRAVIAEIAKFLEENSENACEDVKITNVERQIAFRIGENDYEFTLVQKRKPKV